MGEKKEALVWSSRLGKHVLVQATSPDTVDELLRTGVGTRMLVPDWDMRPQKSTGEQEFVTETGQQ